MDENKKPSFAFLAGTFFMFGASIAVEVYTVRIFLRALEVKSWPTTQGVITRSGFKTKFVGAINHSAHIEYDFSVDNKRYTSTSVRTRGASSKNKSDIEAVIERFPAGTEVPVYYNPDDPSESYLEVGVDIINYVIIISPLVFAVASGGAFLQTFKERRACGGPNGNRQASAVSVEKREPGMTAD